MKPELNINHHLTDELLAGYASGNLSEAADLLVAAHISMCDHCRARSEAFDAVGGAMLESDELSPDAIEMSDASLQATLALIAAGPDQMKPTAPAAPRDIPNAIEASIGGGIDDIRWSPVGMGVKQSVLVSSKEATARLLYIPAGVAVPDHGHRGQELTLVLKGAFSDEDDYFGPGDVEIADEDMVHSPVADPNMDCICLAVTDASLKFQSLLPRLVQPFIGI